MRSPIIRLALAALVVLVALWVASCSKDSNKGTNPPPAGNELGSGSITAGMVFQHTFANAGTFAYQCTIHPQMTGSVTVNASGQDSAVVTIISNTSTGFSPGSVNIKPGGHVRWTNATAMTHNVTSQ